MLPHEALFEWNPNRLEDGSCGDRQDRKNSYCATSALADQSPLGISPISVSGIPGLVVGGFDSIIATWIDSPSIRGGMLVFLLESPGKDFPESFPFDDQIDAVVAEVPPSAFQPANITIKNEVSKNWIILSALENPSEGSAFGYPVQITLDCGDFSVHVAEWDDPTFLLRLYRLNPI